MIKLLQIEGDNPLTYALLNNEWTWENELGVLFLVILVASTILIPIGVFVYIIYQTIKYAINNNHSTKPNTGKKCR